MYIADLYERGESVFSFEFFPPKSETEALELIQTIRELGELNPGFVSVTYPLDRTRRYLTIETVIQIQKKFGLLAMAHLTCSNSTIEEVFDTLEKLEDAGIHNVLALRGDRVSSQDPEGWFRSEPFNYASDLVELIKSNFNFCVGGAAHPEKHPESETLEEDIAHLKLKVEAGCEFLITQLFFDNQDYFRLVEKARNIGINVPIVPGIMPITNVKGIKRILGINGSKLPKELEQRLEEAGDDKEKIQKIGITYAVAQCHDLLENGAPGIHFYTLNRSGVAISIFEQLEK